MVNTKIKNYTCIWIFWFLCLLHKLQDDKAEKIEFIV